MENHANFNRLLRQLMEEKSLSVRKLGQISGIDHATISKIMNGKRKANLTHLEKLSKSLDVGMTTLLEAAGYETDSKKEDAKENQDILKTIQQLIKTTGVYDGEFTLDQVNREIDKYKQISQTDEGKKMIRQEFQAKLNRLDGKGPYVEKLQWMNSRITKQNGTTRQLVFMGAALLYFIVTTDLLPDYLLPIGLLDDAFIVQIISQQLENNRLS
ncbi:helix-turn-helix domain-containing protein [Oceanobacillus luteolus]|uniref:Helix-turn-helix domain-containing protein n=1 Tax=Oceanobacillus luteolus TaxID=1274358 RepID=A0ABW4HWV8_9BACI|nr:helix-turn-helix domain-containing protein [Oceanobacillus luteolus]MCM3742310.1 helix-turn-helix domain-containing protein [Oceanobacillus luteolus]